MLCVLIVAHRTLITTHIKHTRSFHFLLTYGAYTLMNWFSSFSGTRFIVVLMRLFFNDSTTFLTNYFMNSIIYRSESVCFTSYSFLCINILTDFAKRSMSNCSINLFHTIKFMVAG